MPRKKKPPYRIEVFRNGTVKAQLKAFDQETGDLRYEDKEDLATATGRAKAIKRMAAKLKLRNASYYEEQLDQKWHEARDKEEREQRAEADSPKAEKPKGSPYFVEHGRICRQRFGKDGEVFTEPLCNFVATIEAETTYDDGSGEVQNCFRLRGRLAEGQPLTAVDVPAGDFALMNWPLKFWGVRAIVSPGQGAKDHLRCAIQEMSRDASRQVVYRQTGWREIEGEWQYLHAGGTIGTVGTVATHTIDLPGNLARMMLPAPPEGADLAAAVRASLRILDLARERIAAPVLGGVFRAPLGSVDFSMHVVGPSGSFKTELAALAQQHYGAGLDARHLPGTWSSTANATESLCFTAADALVVIDDFAPSGSQADVARFHRDADRVFRGVGNRAGRQRLQANGELRPVRPPRCLPLSTGEEIPKGHSVRGRLGIIDVTKGDIDPQRLSVCQEDARSGLYAAAMAAYLRWMAGRYEQLRADMADLLDELRQEHLDKKSHARTPGILADLALGWRLFLRFAVQTKAIPADEAADCAERARAGLLAMGKQQADHQEGAEPAAHFLRLIRSVVSSGRGHVASVLGSSPTDNAGAWGWRKEDMRDGPTWRPQGRLIGWLDDEALYLDPEGAHAEAQKLAGEQNDSLSLSCQTLGKRLREKGLLTCIDQERDRLTVRRTCQGARRAVWQMSARVFLGASSVPETVPNVPNVPQTA